MLLSFSKQFYVCKDFVIKHLGVYHDFYLESDTLLFGNLLTRSWNFFFSFWISFASSFKNGPRKLLADIDLLSVLEIRGWVAILLIDI